MSMALTTPNPSVSLSDWEVMRSQAALLVGTGFLPSAIKTPEQAVAIILTGRELGIPVMLALGNINVIQGKPSVSPQLMLALIYASHQAELVQVEEETEQRCAVVMKRRGQPAHRETFTIEDAQRITTTEYEGNQKKTIALADKYNWRAMPKTMLKWRAIAACARVVFPDVILGLYTPEELGAEVEVDDAGAMNVIPDAPPGPTPNQKARIHILAKEAGLGDAAYRALLQSTFGVQSCTELDPRQAAALVELLQARAANATAKPPYLFEGRSALEALGDDEYDQTEPEPPEPPAPEPVPTDLLGERVIDDPADRRWRGWITLCDRVKGDASCSDVVIEDLGLPVRVDDLAEAFEKLRAAAKAAQSDHSRGAVGR